MDFFNVVAKEGKNGVTDIYPNFVVKRSTDLMVKGRSFFAIWDEESKLWSTDEYDVQRLVDEELTAYDEKFEGPTHVKYMRNFDSERWAQFRRYVNNISDNAHELDEKLIFSNETTTKEDFATKRLSYPLEAGDHSSWDRLLEVLYSPEERAKIEWAVGAVVAGEAKDLQKFLVFYGPSGTGKSTVLNIVQKLFEGYTVMFDAKSLGQSQNSFATEIFKTNPLVAIQHDGDLSKIEDNTKLNSIISHEEMLVNEKYKASYNTKFNAFLFMGTNQPVKISDAKSGLIRRLIDVEPTGVKIEPSEYDRLMAQIPFELGAIAAYCLSQYRVIGKTGYDDYRPMAMMYKTDPMLNFVSDNYDIFSSQVYTTVRQAYTLYKEYCTEAGIEKPMTRQKLQAELENYFETYEERVQYGGERLRSVFSDFNFDKFKSVKFDSTESTAMVMTEGQSKLDNLLEECPAQLAKEDGTPRMKWESVRTTLSSLDSHELHYVKVPDNHIVIDFDLRGSDGEKELEANIDAASKWPETYAEVSKSGEGVHLHYIYDGDVTQLANEFSEGIEIKVYRGNSSLRRKLTLCNQLEVAHINSGLPFKEKKVITDTTMKSEKSLRELVLRNLRKEIHPGTKPSVDFIKKILDDAYSSGMVYDLTDLRKPITVFAGKSTNQPLEALKTVKQMKFQSEAKDEGTSEPTDDRIAFYDVEVYPNLFLIVWKFQGSDQYVKMVNPEPSEMENLFKLKLVGFNNRRYDNHILYARYMGYDNAALYKLSKRIVGNDRSALFGEAYNLSYADIYDFSSKKQGLKKFEIELGINHMEMDIPWEEPVPDDKMDKVIEYCCNDVMATEKVFEARKADFTAREILASISGLSVNNTTQAHTAKIIFEGNKHPQSKFKYTKLEEMFPGYEYDRGKSTYRGETTGEGGYVYSEPGLYHNVALLDIASMHPTSIEQLDLFGPYTKNFSDLKSARIAIKHGDFDSARKMLDGKLKPFLKDESDAADLSYALKIVINIVYGLTSAKFDNPFRDIRNKDNIVAKRGALFMINLKDEVQKRGFTVAHIKTDSIKIPDATQEIIDFVFEYGKQYGYDFEHEATYEKMCLVNDAVYICKYDGKWSATGAQFQHPYVFKTLFSGEDVTIEDFFETKSVAKGSMYIDTNYKSAMALNDGSMRFVGRTGRFCPVTEESGLGGILYRVFEDKPFAVTGTKGYIWADAEVAEKAGMSVVDQGYAQKLTKEAIATINKFGNYEEFVK